MMNDCIDCSDVGVEVRGGIVILEGSVPERRVKYVIEDIAAECMGANDVENHIRVAKADEGQQGSAAAAAQQYQQHRPLKRHL
jgi:osmotically-inducible protein OsmY